MVSALTLLTLSLTTTALAGGDSPPFRNETSPSPQSQCHQLSRLTRLVETASNATLLAAKTSGDPTKAAELQAKAAAAAEELTTLQADATLMAECVKVFAEDEMRDLCREMKKLQETVADGGKLAKGNETGLRVQAAEGAQRLAELQGNETLVEFCKEREAKGECRQLGRLRGWLAGNGTVVGGGAPEGGDGEEEEGGGGEEKWEERMEKAREGMEELEEACETQGSGSSTPGGEISSPGGGVTSPNDGVASPTEGLASSKPSESGVVEVGGAGSLHPTIGTAMSVVAAVLFGVMLQL